MKKSDIKKILVKAKDRRNDKKVPPIEKNRPKREKCSECLNKLLEIEKLTEKINFLKKKIKIFKKIPKEHTLPRNEAPKKQTIVKKVSFKLKKLTTGNKQNKLSQSFTHGEKKLHQLREEQLNHLANDLLKKEKTYQKNLQDLNKRLANQQHEYDLKIKKWQQECDNARNIAKILKQKYTKKIEFYKKKVTNFEQQKKELEESNKSLNQVAAWLLRVIQYLQQASNHENEITYETLD